jgi:hypothetical protein
MSEARKNASEREFDKKCRLRQVSEFKVSVAAGGVVTALPSQVKDLRRLPNPGYSPNKGGLCRPG